MKVNNNEFQFYGLNFNISFVLQDDQIINGIFSIHETGEKQKFPFFGYYSKEDECINFGFFIEWRLVGTTGQSFSAFHCHVVNPDVLVCDWLLCLPEDTFESGANGSAFLYSTKDSEHFQTTPQSIRPYPIDVIISESGCKI